MALIHPQKPLEQPFTNDPQASYTLPSRFYTDADIYEQEKAAIFGNRGFMLVMHRNYNNKATI